MNYLLNIFNKLKSAALSWQYNTLVPRLHFITIWFAIGYIFLSCRVLYLVMYKPTYNKSYNTASYLTRANILDRHGKVLATNIAVKSLYVKPELVDDKVSLSKQLKSLIPSLDKDKILKDLNSSKKFVWIKRNISPELEEAVYGLGSPALQFVNEQQRVYPYNSTLSHLLGYVSVDNEGLAGIEKYFDDSLSKAGEDLKLSVDVDLQYILEEELQAAIDEFKAIGGVGVIADPNNGEVLAMVSKPDFNPHQLNTVVGEAAFNRATLGVYEVGSVFKPVTMAMALDSKSVTLRDSYHLKDFKVANLVVKDFHKMQEGMYSVPQIFIKSSNIGMAQIALDIGRGTFYNYLNTLGLLEPVQIELPEKAQPLYLPQQRCTDLSLVTMSYGYQLAISPLHLVQSLIPAVNGGIFHSLTLVKDNPKQSQPVKVFDPTTSREINKLLRLTVEQGTGKKAEVAGYLVGGKSGTANKVKNGKYANNARRSSFVSVFPAINPQYVIYLMLDEPKGNTTTFGFATGGYTAAPAVGRIIARLAALRNIEQYSADDPQIKAQLYIPCSRNNNST